MTQNTHNRFSLTKFLWTMADMEVLDALAKNYAYGQNRSRTRTTISLLVFVLLTGTSAWATYYGDILPSWRFVFDVTRRLSGYGVMSRSMGVVMAVFTILPNLLEFGSVGLAVRGSIPVKLSIFVSMMFDMLTDGPTAYAWASVLTTSLLREYALSPLVYRFVEWSLTLPLLFLFTAGLEILTLLFFLTTWRLFLAYFAISAVRRAERAGRGTTRRPPRVRARTVRQADYAEYSAPADDQADPATAVTF
jgi:hypothetical protein